MVRPFGFIHDFIDLLLTIYTYTCIYITWAGSPKAFAVPSSAPKVYPEIYSKYTPNTPEPDSNATGPSPWSIFV